LSVEELANMVKEILSDYVVNIEVGKDLVHVEVKEENLLEAAKRLKEEGFDHVKDVTAVDYPKEGIIKIIYHVSSYSKKDLSRYVVGLSYTISRDRTSVPSLYSVWTSADFQEREVYEGFGIRFEGHPDMRPLLLAPNVAELKPLRKDYVVKEEPIFKK
jgi:NADH-quinone oxidoreductase subunit C